MKAKQAPPSQRRAAGATAKAAHVGEAGLSGSGITAAEAAAAEEEEQQDAGAFCSFELPVRYTEEIAFKQQ